MRLGDFCGIFQVFEAARLRRSQETWLKGRQRTRRNAE